MHSIHPPITSITYRNAIYQGQINPTTQTRQQFGILYMAKTHDFICCNSWHNDLLEGECLFFNDDKQYVYGTWINNLPQGFNVFRFDETLVMAEFYRGKLVKNTKVLVIFERYNIATVLIVANDAQKLDELQMEVYSKSEVYTAEDVKRMFKQCHWPEEYFTNNQTLIKYMTNKLVSYQFPQKTTKTSSNYSAQKQKAKLRLIQNQYYRFGYDDGLAIVFDQDFNRVSVGCHEKNKVMSFGVKFGENKNQEVMRIKEVKDKPQQGKIVRTVAKSQSKDLSAQKGLFSKQEKDSSKDCKTNLLMGVNFCNKFYKNPSKIFAFYIDNIISQSHIKSIIAGSITTRRLYQQTLQFSRIDPNTIDPSNMQSSFIQPNGTSKPNTITPITHDSETKSHKLDREKLMNDRLRLQEIKKEIYTSIEKQKRNLEKQFFDEEFEREIVHKGRVGKNVYDTPQRVGEKSRSRSRKRIFEQSQKNIKILRDFTPSRSQPNLTPFKTKMKNRIFTGQQSRISIHPQRQENKTLTNTLLQTRGKSQSRKQIFPTQYVEDRNEPEFNQFSSDKQRYSNGRLNQNKTDINRGSRSIDRVRNVNRQNNYIQGKGQQRNEKGQVNRNGYKQGDREERRQRYDMVGDEDKHVTFDHFGEGISNRYRNGSIKDSLNNHSSRNSQFYDSKKRSRQYVPIDPMQQKQRKKSIQNHLNSTSQHKQSQKSSKFSSKQEPNQRNHQIKSQQERYIPKSKYYLETRQSGQVVQDRTQVRNRKETQRDQGRLHRQSNERQLSTRQQIQRNDFKGENERKRQVRQDGKRRQIYKDDTFKQTSFPEEFSSSTNKEFHALTSLKKSNPNQQQSNQNDSKHRPSFRHSNQVYLQEYHGTPQRSIQTQTKPHNISNLQDHQNSSCNNKSMTYAMLKDDKKAKYYKEGGSSSSYMQKHKIKKSIEKQIEKSPDKQRCYGKSANNPYLQASPSYSKEYSYQYSNFNQTNPRDYKINIKNDSPYRATSYVYRNSDALAVNSQNPTRTKLF